MTEKFKVYISCMTYNHSAYIIDAMNGFCMQKTDFPFVCGIIDDASTDDTEGVIRNYLEEHFDLSETGCLKRDETDDYVRVFAQHKVNKNCYFVFVLLKYNHYCIGKSKDPYILQWKEEATYLSICEGDDYWIDLDKLQKQVNFMDCHPNHSLCFCAHQVLFPSGEKIITQRYEGDKEICPIKDLILGGGGVMATCSMLYRKKSYVPYQIWAIGCPIGDLPMMLTLANNGLVGYLAEVMCVYRKLSIGSWSSRMSSTIVSRRKHRYAIDKMWRQFDKWTNEKYHSIILKKRRNNLLIHCKDEVKTFFRKALSIY